MTDPASVEAIYASVIEDTIFKLSPEFENAGVPMIVLSRLQELWTKRMELTVRNPVPASIMAPLNQKAVVAPAHVQVSQAQHVKKDESGNGNAVNGSQHSMASSSHQALPHDASSAPHDPLRYTVTEPTPAVKSELVDGQVANNASAAPTAGSSTSNASEDTKVAAEAKKEESDSESSDVSDDDDVDTSTWTNSLMSLYEDPIKRNKDKRTYKLQKGILHINGQDYLFKNGKAEFAWI